MCDKAVSLTPQPLTCLRSPSHEAFESSEETLLRSALAGIVYELSPPATASKEPGTAA